MKLVLDFGLFLFRVVVGSFLITPVGSDTSLGNLIHLFSTDLDFKISSGRSPDRRMKGLVPIRLWPSDVVLKPAGNRFEVCMDIAKNFIALLFGPSDYTQSKKIINFFEGMMLGVPLLVDRIDRFDSIRDFKRNTGFLKNRRQFLFQLK